jgi:hypothetical protein
MAGGEASSLLLLWEALHDDIKVGRVAALTLTLTLTLALALAVPLTLTSALPYALTPTAPLRPTPNQVAEPPPEVPTLRSELFAELLLRGLRPMVSKGG